MSSTISITTEATAAAWASTASLGLIAVIILLMLLVQKEIAVTSPNPRTEFLRRILNIGIVPMFVVFAVIVGAKLFEVLG
ncbi:MAG: hypothetical protein JW953_11910 [Anaerolineae bacterium]|nr:hypothetical protein [Anaerolineae bacterium]